jgi:hypothetical protein
MLIYVISIICGLILLYRIYSFFARKALIKQLQKIAEEEELKERTLREYIIAHLQKHPDWDKWTHADKELFIFQFTLAAGFGVDLTKSERFKLD